MTKEERKQKKLAIRAEVRTDLTTRFPRLHGKRLEVLVNRKSDMLLSELVKESK